MEQYQNTNIDTHSNTNSNPNRYHQVHFVEFRNIMMPIGNIQNFQDDYNNTNINTDGNNDVKVELLDNSYEQNVIQNTVDTV